MTDATPTPPTPEPAATPAAPAYAAAPVAAGPKQTQSLVSFIIGIVAVLFSFAPFVNLLAFIGGIVAVILGFRAKKAEPAAPKWMSMVGIIAGFVAIGLSLILGLVYIFTFIAPLLFLGSYGSVVGNY